MPNISSVTNYFPTVFESSVTMTLGTTISPGATTVSVNGMTNYANGEVVVFTIDPANSAKQVFTGTVSGTSVINVVWTYGTNVTHTSGASIIDYVSSTTLDMVTTGILKQHNQNGTHQALTNTGGLTTDILSVTSSASIVNPSPVGTVSGWIGANESWSYASSTTITVPTNATTKYDVGDYLQLTQSSTVKYFVVTTVAATLLTVAGIAGATVANSAITLNSYFKANPHSIGAGEIFNPYQCSVYWNAGAAGYLTTGGTWYKMKFDTKSWDNNTNFDVVTNFRYTAPVAGKYHIDAQVLIDSAGTISAGNGGIDIYKNGLGLGIGQFVAANVSLGNIYPTVSRDILLAAGDYLEVWGACSTSSIGISGGMGTFFNIHLISQL